MFRTSAIISTLLFFIIPPHSAIAHGQVAISFFDVVIPEAPPVASVMVAYMRIKNNINTKKTITKISSPQFKRVEIHKMSMANGMMNMKQLKSLTIKTQQTIILESGGVHIMLINPIKPLKDKDRVALSFQFSSGEMTTINTHVQRVDLTESQR